MTHLTGKINLILILVTIYQKYQISSLWKTKASYQSSPRISDSSDTYSSQIMRSIWQGMTWPEIFLDWLAVRTQSVTVKYSRSDDKLELDHVSCHEHTAKIH